MNLVLPLSELLIFAGTLKHHEDYLDSADGRAAPWTWDSWEAGLDSAGGLADKEQKLAVFKEQQGV